MSTTQVVDSQTNSNLYGRMAWTILHSEAFWSTKWMCKTAYSILIERVAKYVSSKGGNFDVRFEQVGKKEDRAIIQYAKDLKTTGSPFNKDTSSKYHSCGTDDYRKIVLGEPRGRTKNNLFIQIADLYLYPMAKRKHDPNYRPWQVLAENKKVIDALLQEDEYENLGIKYSCFDEFGQQKT